MESIGKIKVLVAAAAMAVGFAAFGVEWSGTVTPEGDISEPITLNGEVEVTVASGTTITLSGAISDGATAGSIKLVGGGTLALAHTNDFTGGVYVEAGVLKAMMGLAFGTGKIIVEGASGDKTAVPQSQVRFGNLDDAGNAATFVFPNDIEILNSGDADHSQLVFGPVGDTGKRKSLKLTGKIDCAGKDLYFKLDNTFSTSASDCRLGLADLTAAYLSLDKPTIQIDFNGKLDVDRLELGNKGMSTVSFYSNENRIGAIELTTSKLSGTLALGFGGASINYLDDAKGAAISINNNVQTCAWIHAESTNAVINTGTASSTLVLTGGVDFACYNGQLTNNVSKPAAKLNVTLAADPTFVQVFSNNVHFLRGTLTVKGGTMLFGGENVEFPLLPTIDVQRGRFVLDTAVEDPLPSLATVKIGGEGFIDLCGRTIVVDTLTIGGESLFYADHETNPDQIAEGTVIKACLVSAGISTTTVDWTAKYDWVVKVPANSTNIVEVAQTGSGKIIKLGEGWLLLTKESSFTGGVELREGRVTVDPEKAPDENNVVATTALGTGTLTICGQTDAYAGVCQLEIIGAGKDDPRIVTVANDIQVTGNTTGTYPALRAFGQNSVLTGKITAAQDFIFHEDYASTAAISSSQYNRYSLVTVLTFGDIEAAGMIGTGGFSKFVLGGKVVTPLINPVYTIAGANMAGNGSQIPNAHVAIDLTSDQNEIGRIKTDKHPIGCFAANALGGALIDFSTADGYAVGEDTRTAGRVVLNNYDQTVAGFESANVNLENASADYDGPGGGNAVDFVFGYAQNNQTVTIKGVPSESGTNLVACCLMGHWGKSGKKDTLSLVLDSDYPNFTQTFRNRHSPMGGTITVNRGTFKIDGTATFSNVTAITVGPEGVFVDESTHACSLMNVTTLSVAGRFKIAESVQNALPATFTSLSLYDGCELDVPEFSEVTVQKLYLNDCGVKAGVWTHDDCTAIPKGMTITATQDGGGITAETTAVWMGEAGDGKMTTLGNWLVDGVVPQSLDLTSGKTAVIVSNGVEMLPDVDGLFVNSITFCREATKGNSPFFLGAKGGVLTVDKKIYSSKMAQIVVRGTIAVPYHRDQGSASNGGTYTFTYFASALSKADAPDDTIWGDRTDKGPPIVLDEATIEKPCYFRGDGAGAQAFYVQAHTTNIVSGALNATQNGWHELSVGEGAVLDCRGGLTGENRPVLSNAGVLKITGKPWDRANGISIENGTLELDATNCVFKTSPTQNYGIRIGTGSGGTLRFDRSYCFNDDNETHFDIVGSKKFTIDFNATTQRVTRIWTTNSNKDSSLTGDYPAMLEVKGGTADATKLLMAGMTNSVQVIGGLGFHYLGNGPANGDIVAGEDDTLVLAGKNFESCGDLVVSAGTLELAAGATWLNGTNFIAKGTGTLKFAAAEQVNKTFATLHVADQGKIYVPEGVRMRFTSATLNGEPVEEAIYPTGTTGSTGLSAHIEGGGSIRIKRPGTVLIVQ